MLVVMKRDATPEQVEHVVNAIRESGLMPHPLPGATRTAIGITGNTGSVDSRNFEVLPGVLECIRVTKAYKLTGREMHPQDTILRVGSTTIGAGTFTIIAGPCSVENETLTFRMAEMLMQRGIKLMRAGAFKPRTSPYSFQGLGSKGLEILVKAREKTGIGIVTELMDTEHADEVEAAADMIQIGTRNMQNFSLLRRVSTAKKAGLLKRGMSGPLQERVVAGEYILAGGNFQVALCERGVRTFADHSRNTLDLSIVPPVKKHSHLPILVDPSHGTGKAEFVPAMALAGLAAGADGLLVEVHPEPAKAMSDAAQTIDFATFDKLLSQLKRIAEPLGKTLN